MEAIELDYALLMNHLREYQNPRDKVRRMLQNGDLIRVKKGIYAIDPEKLGGFSKQILANMIYGPSYVSMDYALSMYDLIPERVETVTSVTTKREKEFRTPVGVFKYYPLHDEKYSVGITRVTIADRRGYLMATKEKALIDKTYKRPFKSSKSLLEYLVDGLRIEPRAIKALDQEHLRSIVERFRSQKTAQLLLDLVGVLNHE